MICSLLGLLIGSGSAAAGSAHLLFENDSFADTDQHYTGGLKLAWAAASAPGPWRRALRPEAAAGSALALGYALFTPADIEASAALPDQRPYAGWLYAIGSLSAADDARLDQVDLMLGVVGPAAGGERVQTKLHDWTDSRTPGGWENQLPNEPGVAVSYRQTRRLAAEGPVEVDALPFLGGSLGTVYTHAAGGVMLRLGRGLSADYGPPRIRPSLSGALLDDASQRVRGYLLVGAEGRAVGRNLFLDGSTFQPSASVEKQVWVGALEAGASLGLGGWRLSYTHVVRSPEFVGQSEPDDFGSLALSFTGPGGEVKAR